MTDGALRTAVLIVGAGPTGLALALWLTRLGVRVRIVDRNAGPGETSRAFAVQARTLELYDQIGLAEAAVARGRPLSVLNVHERGERIARIPFGAFGSDLSPFPHVLVLLQDRHEKLLIEPLAQAGVEVERNTELLGFEDHGTGVRARLRRAGGRDEYCEADFICGCDGVSSTVRALMEIDFPGGTYAQDFYVADVQAEGSMADGEVHYAMAGEALCSVFPLVGTDRVRLIGRAPGGAETGGRPASFEDVAFQVGEATGLKIGLVEWFSTYRVHNRVAEHFRKGRAFLLGDAGHAHTPAGSQGLNAGVGDAANLAWKLAAVLRGQADPALLDTYEAERMAVARKLVAATDTALKLQVGQAGPMRRLRLAAIRLAPGLMDLRWAREWLFETVSQLRLNYRGGPLSAGRAGGTVGGDRLPWVKTADGADNFAALRASSWQVHVYGQAGSPLRDACARLGLPLHEFTWDADFARKGLARDALYLVRPDGYVAYASAGQDVQGMERLFSAFKLRPAP